MADPDYVWQLLTSDQIYLQVAYFGLDVRTLYKKVT